MDRGVPHLTEADASNSFSRGGDAVGTTSTNAGPGPRLPTLGYTALSSVLLLEEHLPPPWQEAAHSNLSTLFLIHSTLAFIGSIFRVQPSYALPLSLAGLIIVSLTTGNGSPIRSGGISTGSQAASHSFLLSVLTLFLLLSTPVDFVWLWRHLGSSDTRFFVVLATLISLFLKPLTLLTLAQLLRNQGVLDPPAAAPSLGGAIGAGSGSYWEGARQTALGANGGWLGGGAGGGANRSQGIPGSWSGPSASSQQQRSSSAAVTQHQQPQRPYSTASSNFTFSEGYQTYDSDEDAADIEGGAGRSGAGVGGGPEAGVAIPGRGRPPSEADATPISASFAREAGFVHTQPPQ